MCGSLFFFKAKNKSFIEMGNNFLKCQKYKTGDKYCLQSMEEKLAVASYNILNELLNQRSEILNACRH